MRGNLVLSKGCLVRSAGWQKTTVSGGKDAVRSCISEKQLPAEGSLCVFSKDLVLGQPHFLILCLHASHILGQKWFPLHCHLH